jgi:hypothetical protein
MAVKRYDGSAWQVVAGKGDQGTSSSISTWVKTASGGETSLSGNDDNSQSLSYTVGQELVFINGTLLKRGSDYTATNGTSITGLTALAANDVATVWTVNAFSVTGAIANTIVDAKGDLLVGTAADTPGRLAVGTDGQVLTAASTTGTGLTWSTPATGALTLINRTTFSNVASQTIDNIFTSTYTNYIVVLENIWNHTSRNNDLAFQLVYSGTAATTGYYGNARGWNENATIGGINSSGSGQMNLAPDMGGDADEGYNGYLVFTDVATGGNKKAKWHGHGAQYADFTGSIGLSLLTWGSNETARAYTGLKLLASAGNISGKITTYGLANS